MRPFSCAVCALNALQNSMMLTPCWPSAGPTGGAGLACPPGICSLISVRTFFAISDDRPTRSCSLPAKSKQRNGARACGAHVSARSRRLRARLGTRRCAALQPCSECEMGGWWSPLVELLHLIEAELDGHLALEDVDEHLQLLRVGIDVHDLAVEVAQRARGYLHRLAKRVLDLRPRPCAFGGARVQDAVDLHLRQRHGLVAGADESGDARRVLHDRPRIV